MRTKAYVGDGVYAEIESGDRVILTTAVAEGEAPTNRIVLEPDVLRNLIDWLLLRIIP